MNRLLSILVTLFILFLVYLWINHLTGTHAESDRRPEKTTRLTDPQIDDTPEDIYSEPAESQEEPSDATAEDNTPAEVPAVKETEKPVATPEPKKEEPQKVVEKPKPAEEKPKPVVKQTPPAPVKTVTKSTDAPAGMHLVIAGNFLEKANAEERVRELKKLGYPLAEVVNFELSEYHTACAGRYSDLNEARKVSKKIKEMHGIDTYVRLGN